VVEKDPWTEGGSVKLVLIGARKDGQAHIVLDTLAEGVTHEVVAFLDETPSLWNTKVHGIPVLGPPSRISDTVVLGAAGGMVSIGNGPARERLAPIIVEAGLDLPSLVHPRAYVASSAGIGCGVFVGAMAVVSTGAEIHDLAFVPPTAFISHHVHLGPYATLSPGVRLGGRSRVGRRAFLGLGAIVLPDVTIGDDAVIGAGVVVTRDVPAGTTLVGVSPRVMTK
jgi:sugar O-acyltransferase (sialic acid O-acetyltransferase NeuD family)